MSAVMKWIQCIRGALPVLIGCAMIVSASGTWAVEGRPDRPWTDDVIYFVMTDRFFDGDPSNNIPEGSDPALYDPDQQSINLYHGGDLRGLERAIQSGYFNRLGVTALWLTPVVKNAWRSNYDLGDESKTGYHGYWAQDFLDIDPHLTSAERLDGTAYAEGREGRLEHYRDFIRLAHDHGIKVIQDVVTNHAGPVFFYDVAGDGEFDPNNREQWIMPFRQEPYENVVWMNKPEWNLRRVEPTGPTEVLGVTVPQSGAISRLESFSRRGFSRDSLGKRDGEEVLCDFFALRTYDTSPEAPHFADLVSDFVEIKAFYIETLGVDGLRIDTVKHVHHEFWDAFTEGLRERLGADLAARVLLFGEVYDGDPNVLGRFTYRSDWPENRSPAMDSVLDFQFCFAVRDFVRVRGGGHGRPHSVEEALRARISGIGHEGRPFYNPEPGLDGRNAAAKAVPFIENHDGLNRFRVRDVDEDAPLLGTAILLTTPGIPALYYGSEGAIADEHGELFQDSETGRITLFDRRGERRAQDIETTRAFRNTASLTAARAEWPSLRVGAWTPLWAGTDDSGTGGTLVYLRHFPGEIESVVLVAVNAAADERTVNGISLAGAEGIEWPATGTFAPLTLDGFETPGEVGTNGADLEALVLPPRTASVFHFVP